MIRSMSVMAPAPTEREPRLALTVTLERMIPGLPSVAEIAAVIGALVKAFVLGSPTAPGTVDVFELQAGLASSLLVIEEGRTSFVVSGGGDGGIRSWLTDGRKGPLASGGGDGALRSWRLDGERGPLEIADAHDGVLSALVAIEHEDQPLIVSGGGDGALRSWRLDGRSGPLEIPKAVWSLATLVHEHQWVILSGRLGRELHSWRLDGHQGPVDINHAHEGAVSAIVTIEYQDQPLIVSGGGDGALRSWRLDGRAGPLQVSQVHTWMVWALVAAAHEGQPLIVSSGAGGAIASWRLDGRPGPLSVSDVRQDRVGFSDLELANLDSVGSQPWMSLGTRTASQLEVRHLSFASPLELQLHVPAALLGLLAVLSG